MEGTLQAAVGRNIRRWRREEGLSQEVFGEQVGWHRTFVGAVERGERNLTLKSVERISEQLGIDPLDLLWDREQVAFRADGAGGGRFVPGSAPELRAAADDATGEAPARGRTRRPKA